MTIAVQQRVLGPSDAGVLVTRAEYSSAEFQKPFLYERVHGRLVVMSPAGAEHRFVSRPFRQQLGLYWGLNPELVDDVDVEGWVATSEDDDRLPDICVYLSGPTSHEVVPDRVPDLIFEFVSANRTDQERDYIHKRQEYHRIGVREYVIVDRFKQQVFVLRWQPTDYDDTVLNSNDTYTTPLLPGLTVIVGNAFAES